MTAENITSPIAVTRTKQHLAWHHAASGIDTDAMDAANGASGSGSERSSSPAPESAPAPAVGMPQTSHYRAKGSIPNTPLVVSLISAGLGGIAGICLFVAVVPVLQALGAANWSWVRPQLAIYLASIAVFHLLEFWTTAGWNYQKLSVDGMWHKIFYCSPMADTRQPSSSTTRPTTTSPTPSASRSTLYRPTSGPQSSTPCSRRPPRSCRVSTGLNDA
jgi:hypothetical protein